MADIEMKEKSIEEGRLPAELREFFMKEGRSLIIRGAPGTGKTTLAMEILEDFKSSGESVFISARIDEQALKSHLRWVNFDILLSRGRDPGSKQRREGMLSRSELDRLESRVEDGDETLEGDYDSEPGSGTVEGNTWTIDITALLPEIDSLYEKLEKKMPTRAMVAIDSIDSLAEKYGIAPRRLIHTLQKDLVERSGVNVIFISETAENTGLDFMGDGVISLEMVDVDARRLRVMKLEKLRGQSIRNPEMVFSLAHGRFDCFAGEGTMEAAPQNIELGGLLEGIIEPGKYTVLEFHGSVPAGVVRRLVRAVCAAAANEGCGIYTTPSLRLLGAGPPGSLKDAVPDHSAVIRIISPVALLRKDSMDAGAIMVDGDSFQADFDKSLIDSQFPDKSGLLFLMDANQLLSHYGREAVKDIENHIAHLLRGGGSCIGFSWPASNPVDMDLGLCDMRFTVKNRGPNILFYGEKPHTPIHVLAPDSEKEKRFVPKPVL